MTLSSHRDDGYLTVAVRDTGVGIALTPGQGVGLSNVRERLAALYGGQASLTLTGEPDGGACAQVRIPWSVH